MKEYNRVELAIVGIWYDGYYDIWEDFLELKDKFWPDCPYPMYIVNQTKQLEYTKKYDVSVINAGADAEYSKKIQVAIDRINAERYLILLEDFFFCTKLNGDVLGKVLEFMKNNHLLYYSMPLPEFFVAFKGSPYKGNKHLQNIDPDDEYTVCCQPAIWERDFLKQCIGTGNYNAWVFEGIYCKSKLAHTNEFLSKCVVDLNNILGLRHGALQGKIIPPVLDVFQSIGYKMKNQRPQMSLSEYKKNERKKNLKMFIPLNVQKIIKKYFKTSSVIERYKEEIEAQMKLMKME